MVSFKHDHRSSQTSHAFSFANFDLIVMTEIIAKLIRVLNPPEKYLHWLFFENRNSEMQVTPIKSNLAWIIQAKVWFSGLSGQNNVVKILVGRQFVQKWSSSLNYFSNQRHGCFKWWIEYAHTTSTRIHQFFTGLTR